MAQIVKKTWYTPTESDLVYARLDATNQPFTAPTTWAADDGVNEWGMEGGTYDLTGIGYGKYPTLIPRSNGTLGDGTGVIEGSLVVGNGIAGYFGHGLVFLNDANLVTQTLLAQFNWDGLGNNRINAADDFNVATLLTSRWLTVGNGNTDPYITFNGSDLTPPNIKYKESTLSILPSIRVNLINKGLWFVEHDVNSATGEKISLFGDRFDQDDAYSIGVESNAVFMKSPVAYTWYIATNPSYINPQTAYTMRLLDTGLEVVGDYLGTSFTIGANTLTTSEFAFLDGQDQAVKTDDDVTFASVAGDGSQLTGLPNVRQKPFYFNDLLVAPAAIDPWVIVAVATGTIAAVTGIANHPGIWRIVSHATNANSGYRITNVYSEHKPMNGYIGECVFKVTNAAAGNNEIWFGFGDTTVYPVGNNNVCFQILQSTGTIFGQTGDGTTNNTGTSYTYTDNTWYRARFEVNAAGTLVTFYLYSMAGALLWSDTLATHIPTAAISTGLCGINTAPGGAAKNVVDIDYLYITNSGLTR